VILADTHVAWYAARAGGIVAFALLSASVVLGLALSGRARSTRWPRFALQDVHRFAGILAGVFVAVHGAALLVDTYLPFSLGDLLVPGTAPYRPFSTALGVIGAELLAALAVTNLLRSRLPHATWRRLHLLNFAVWGLALVHGIAAGTDGDTGWALALYTTSTAAVVGLAVWRVLAVRAKPRWELALWPLTAAVLAAELVAAVTLGSVT
jgi:methionine sulfoxide reductase heme-binding subunit